MDFEYFKIYVLFWNRKECQKIGLPIYLDCQLMTNFQRKSIIWVFFSVFKYSMLIYNAILRKEYPTCNNFNNSSLATTANIYH